MIHQHSAMVWSSGIVKYIALQLMMDFKRSPFQLRMVLWHCEIRSIVLTPVWNCVVHSLTGIFHVVPGGWLKCSYKGPMNSWEWYLYIDYSQVNHGNHRPGHFRLHFSVYGITPNDIQQNPVKICQLPILQKLLCSELKMLQARPVVYFDWMLCYLLALTLYLYYCGDKESSPNLS